MGIDGEAEFFTFAHKWAGWTGLYIYRLIATSKDVAFGAIFERCRLDRRPASFAMSN